jgi:hypothetical protein
VIAVAAPARTVVEVFRAEPAIPRAIESLDAFVRSAPASVNLVETTNYIGDAEWLIVWGPGEAVRAAAIRRQVASGGHAIAIDLAYWSRNRKVRISIDGPHPQKWVMRRTLPETRLTADQPPISNVWNERGPIIIAGVGCKARKQYGAQTVEAWENKMAAECRRLFPKRLVVRRPKKPITSPIEQALRGASLLITWHSNVAVDAIRMGVPVVCKDGAAAAICPSTVSPDQRPMSDEWRMRFLSNLAWFQWDLPHEGEACWAFLQEILA